MKKFFKEAVAEVMGAIRIIVAFVGIGIFFGIGIAAGFKSNIADIGGLLANNYFVVEFHRVEKK